MAPAIKHESVYSSYWLFCVVRVENLHWQCFAPSLARYSGGFKRLSLGEEAGQVLLGFLPAHRAPRHRLLHRLLPPAVTAG